MTHDRYASYREMKDAGLFQGDDNCLQYLLDVGILPQYRHCPTCANLMTSQKCSTLKHRDGYCWSCCGNYLSLRTNSILENRKISCSTLIEILNEFSRESTVDEAANVIGVSSNTVRYFCGCLLFLMCVECF